MARKKSKQSNKTRFVQNEDEMNDEIDQFMDQRGFVDFNASSKKDTKSILDDEVLALSSEPETSDDDLGEGYENYEDGDLVDSDEESDESSDYYSGEEKQKKKKQYGDGDDVSRWGKKKHIYYGTDYVDDEMISSDEEAREEEEEALQMQKAKAKELDEDDYLDTMGSLLQAKQKGTPSKKTTVFEEEPEEKFLRVEKDASKLSIKEKLDIVMNDSPELIRLLSDLRDGIMEIDEKLQPTMELISPILPYNKAAEYLEVKFLLLVNYCVNIGYYLHCKAAGEPVKDHPVIDTLYKFRTLLDQLGPIDSKIASQFEALLAEFDEEEGEDSQGSQQSEESEEVAPRLSRKERMKAQKKKIEDSEDEGEVEFVSFKKKAIPVPVEKKESRRPVPSAFDNSSEDDAGLSFDDSDSEDEAQFVRMPKKRSFDSMLELTNTLAPPAKRAKLIKEIEPKQVESESEPESGQEDEGEDSDMSEGEEDYILAQMKAMQKDRPQEVTLDEPRTGRNEELDQKRAIDEKMEKNRGLRKERSKKKLFSARANYREKHRKAVIRRKGQVQPMRDNKKRYSGEATGIKSHLVKSVSLQ
eukprot:TRINITY_DN6564_c0_g1_i1.p1 TRINITY_DN6564_c0_g1~~TRINITY_DN6564_c0_g1_i1.p1  ORF type:complete len:584 (+),score=208.71 TRINITY_DN6564_c0_g1_i1:121-1872(+)